MADPSVKSLMSITEDKKAEVIRNNPSILQICSIWFKDGVSHRSELKPLVRCDEDIKINTLFRNVIDPLWKLKNPQIVVLMLSNVGPVNEWTNAKQIKSFQKGLMKAAENTNMWLIASGIDIGSTSIIGEAVTDYMTEAKYKRSTTPEEIQKKFNFIGIVDEKMLNYLPTITESKQSKIEIPTEGLPTGDEKYELNKNLSHYILVHEKTADKNGVNIFLHNFIQFLALNQIGGENVTEDKEDIASIETNEVPVVSIIIKGGFGSSRLVLKQIQSHIPIIVLRGSGGLADLLAFVDLEIRDRNLNEWDAEFVEMYLKPELKIRIIEKFPNMRNNLLMCNQFRNRILEIVRQSRQSGQNYLTVINMFDIYSCDLENLTEHMLLALFRSQRTERENEEQLEVPTAMILKDLHLCVDWNCPEVAKKEILAKHPNFSLNSDEGKKLFKDSMLRHNRWKFIDLFLSQRFKLRSLITPKRMVQMFVRVHKNKFFATICWEGILNRPKYKKLGKTFFPVYFNWLVEACTGIAHFLAEDELDTYVTQNYIDNKRSAERKALAILLFWCLFDFRKDLVRTLWRYSDQPILMAIIIAMTYEHLSWYVTEETLSNKLKEESKLFVSFACDILDLVYKNSPYRAEAVLNESTKDWEFKTTVEMAAFGKFKFFFTHESVQRWLTSQTYGNIDVKDPKHGIIVPAMIKLLLSAYLILPCYFWITINDETEGDKVEFFEEEDNEDVIERTPQISPNPSDQNTDSSPEPSKPQLLTKDLRKERFQLNLFQTKTNRRGSPTKSQPFCDINWWIRVVYELWRAPITKFWNFQFSYAFYLATFSIATLYPRCGDKTLDAMVCIWTSLIIVDNIRQTFHLRKRQSKVSIIRILQILFQIFFVFYHFYNRLFRNSGHYIQAYYVKVVMCVALIHAYYVLLTVFLPISATLGPLLYRIRIMIFVDFLNFIRLSILVMISFGVVIQAVLFPDLELNSEAFRQAFHRAFFSLFRSFSEDLLAEDHCDGYLWPPENQNYKSVDDCSASVYSDERCRVTGFWPYFLLITYYILLKLILMTLLMAIYASSATRLTADTDSIWKFQRYGLVMDFVTRLPLPPPLNIFYYIYLLLRFLWALLCDCCANKEGNKLGFFNRLKHLYSGPEPQPRHLTDDDYTLLRMMSSEVYANYENKISSESMAVQQFERTKANSEELEYHRRSLRQLKGKMCELERAIRQSHATLETIRHSTDNKLGLEGIGHKNLHVLSRQTPYPFTNVQRYPVPDKYVSWKVMFVDYDPVAYTKPRDEFSFEERPYVDADVLLEASQAMSGRNTKMPKLEWNRLSVSGPVTIDRRSWDQYSKGSIYELDNGIPINPKGRTGLRGRGALYRWGPNHYLMLVITRVYEISNKRQKFEVLVENIFPNSISLITRFIPEEITYKSLEPLFRIKESQHKNWSNSEVMIEYFKSFDQNRDIKTDSLTSLNITPNLVFERLIRGYFDDPLNTDQAWKETELWHFHYTAQQDVLNNAITSRLQWKQVNETFFSSVSISHSQVIQTIIRKHKIDIRN